MNTSMTPQSATIGRARNSAVLNVFGAHVIVLGGGKETVGVFSLAKVICPPGTGAPPHTHVESEHFHVVRGRLTIRLGEENHELNSGDTVHIPSGAPHAFTNNTEDEVEFLAIASPAGHETFFHDADELSRSGKFNPATAAEVCRNHGIDLQ